MHAMSPDGDTGERRHPGGKALLEARCVQRGGYIAQVVCEGVPTLNSKKCKTSL